MSVHRERIISAALENVQSGASVFTADGERLGAVKDIHGEWLKIAAPLRPDYWINADYVIASDGERVELSFNKPDLGAYRITNPDLETTETGTPATADAAMTPDEQLDQRIRMERDLATQRRELPHMHPAGETAPPDTFGTIGEPVEAELTRMESGGAPSYDATVAERAASAGVSRTRDDDAFEPLGYARRLEAWTDAMHPAKSRHRWLVLLAVAVLGCAGAAIAYNAMRGRR